MGLTGMKGAMGRRSLTCLVGRTIPPNEGTHRSDGAVRVTAIMKHPFLGKHVFRRHASSPNRQLQGIS